MVESERLLQSGIITREYLREETICDYHVGVEDKKLWAISLDLLLKFDEFAKRHNLRWFLFYGSLLGAVRHHGFIPWDDDVDVVMPREDFDRLYSLADEFSAPYFLQTPYTDPAWVGTTIRLRNSNTAYIDAPFQYQGFNQGISLSVAPLDYVPENAKDVYDSLHELIMDNSTYMRLGNPRLSERDKERVHRYKGGDPLKTYERIHNTARNVPESDRLWLVASQHYGMDRSIFERSDFSDPLRVQFEHYAFPIPSGYDRILRTIYGDYLSFPPVEQRGAVHSNATCYPDVPYAKFVEKL